MSTYSDRAFLALAQFNGRLSDFVETVKGCAPDPPRLPKAALNELLEIAARARTASDAISRSFTLIDVTSLDVVDMQVRLQGETARLASALRELGDVVGRQHFVRQRFEDPLVALDEAAQLVAAAVFPSAVQGLREVNVKLWDFEKTLWKRYTDLLTSVVQRGSIDAGQQARIQAIADAVARAFGSVNMLLNDLAEGRPTDAAALRRRLARAPEELTAALETARQRLEATDKGTLSAFGPVIKAAAKVAAEVSGLLRKLTIPVFPDHDALGPCRDLIERPHFESLSGVQAFALLNILARLKATRAAGRPLLDGRRVRVTHVFADRIYLEADRAIVDDMDTDAEFAKAPAGLHRFKEGSFKQTTFKKGNLQVCYATRPGDRVAIDADMDLYRLVVPHLFGEVLVNHLTGNTTDQFRVRSILDDQRIDPVGGFELLRA